MSLKRLFFGIFLKEFGRRLFPRVSEIILSFILALAFKLACNWSVAGFVIFFMLSLLLIYLIPRILVVVRLMLAFRRMKNQVSNILKPFESLKHSK